VFGVRPLRPHAVRVERDLVIPARDGVPPLANGFYAADVDNPAGAAAQPLSANGAEATAAELPRNLFRREGEYWTVA
jgi:hypothetical protein